jgi:hypothetical protein
MLTHPLMGNLCLKEFAQLPRDGDFPNCVVRLRRLYVSIPDRLIDCPVRLSRIRIYGGPIGKKVVRERKLPRRLVPSGDWAFL